MRPETTRALRGASHPLLAAILLAALTVALVSAPTAAARPLFTGIAGIGDYEPEVFAQARSTGAQMTRLVLRWEDVAPKREPASWQPENPADPNYNWSYIDRGVTEAAKAGLIPVLLIEGAPAWAQRCQTPPGIQPTNLCDPSPADLAAFARAAATRYSGRFAGLPHVQYWQGLNEPNLSLFFYPQFEGERPVSPVLYRALLNSFYAAVKSVDPTDLVIAAGLGPIAVPGLTIGPMRFARVLLCMHGTLHPRPNKGSCEGGVHFDIFDIHPYTTGGPTHEGGVNDVELGDIAKLKTLIDAADRAGRIKGRAHTELWNTEFSWDSNPPDPGGLPMSIETGWIAEALYRSWSAGVSHFFWYSLEDEPPQPSRPFSETLQSGLFFYSPNAGMGQPKEALSAFRFPFVAYPTERGLTFWGRAPTSAAGQVTIQLWQHGAWRNARTAQAGKTGIFSGTIDSSYGHNERGFARAMYAGEAAPAFSMKPVKDFRQPPFG